MQSPKERQERTEAESEARFPNQQRKKTASSPFGFQVALLGFRAGSAELLSFRAGLLSFRAIAAELLRNFL